VGFESNLTQFPDGDLEPEVSWRKQGASGGRIDCIQHFGEIRQLAPLLILCSGMGAGQSVIAQTPIRPLQQRVRTGAVAHAVKGKLNPTRTGERLASSP
jgi:hypothetical protein